MTNEISTELLEQLKSNPNQNGLLFAESEKISGEFFLEGLDIRINLSDDQLDKIEKSDDLKKQYMQAYHHEYAHLYQVLALPAFQLLWASRNNYVRAQAFLMLKFFEVGGSFNLEKNSGLIDVLEVPNLPIQDDDSMKFFPIFSDYNFHINCWHEKEAGVSFYEIIEGMAHVMSLQLSDTPDTDELEIMQSPKYSVAYKHFEKEIAHDQFETRWKYLLFIYICYFASQHISVRADIEAKEHLTNNATRMFVFLCSRAQNYLTVLKKLHQRYERYNADQLKALNRWKVLEKDFIAIDSQKHASIYAFFELIEMIEDEAKTKGLNKKLHTEALDDFYKVTNDLDVDLQDVFTLARMVIFPANFYWLPEIHNTVMASKAGENEFTYRDETEFYHFISRCNLLFDDRYDVLCCEKHGVVERRKKILNCTSEGGLAFTLKELTGRSANELFVF